MHWDSLSLSLFQHTAARRRLARKYIFLNIS